MPPHARRARDVTRELSSDERGLGSADAEERLREYGRNTLPPARRVSLLSIVLAQFRSPVIYVLLIAAAGSLIVGALTDALFIVAVLAVNAAIGAAQEHGAERGAEALRKALVTRARVLRDHEALDLDSGAVVPGDVLVLEPGDKVPADARLLWANGLEVDESLLTGESLPVAKEAERRLAPETPLADRVNMVFSGALVVRGRGHALVTATGLCTELGTIARAVTGRRAGQPPLLVRMARFTRRIGVAIGVVVIFVAVVSLARGAALRDVLFLSVALAVSAIPEGLPVAMTVALSLATRRMHQRNVIVRRLVAVEALGSCTFIASDKTGTLTMNELSAHAIAIGDTVLEGDALRNPPTEQLRAFRRLLRAAVLCNEGTYVRRGDEWIEGGDAVDVALLRLGHEHGLVRDELEAEAPRHSTVPFESERRWAATSHISGAWPALPGPDEQEIAVKGAVEPLMTMCDRMLREGGEVPVDVQAIERTAHRMAERGHRVVAIAGGLRATADDLERPDHLVFLGLVGMLDPVRPDVPAAIEACRRAGVKVAMITGDHPITARTIARELRLSGDEHPHVVTGVELGVAERKGQGAVDALVAGAHVFARVDPTQKLRIVESLGRLGHFVAVTGDGANDAPALRAAHVGIAMGRRGTDVARETAQLVLTDDRFASIVAAIEEGRVAFANVRKVIFLLVSSGAAEILLFLLAIAAGLPPPLVAVQLLWLNLVTNGIQDVALAFEPKEGDELTRRPRDPREPIFDRVMIERVLLNAAVMGTVAFLSYERSLHAGVPLEIARNETLLLLVLFENLQAGNSRSERRSLFSLPLLGNRLLFFGTIAAQLVHLGAMYVPGLREALHVTPVTFGRWLELAALAMTVLLASELHKALLRRRAARP
ncbi:MAG: HAD-IC family P-type ATPase [Deltaproteobacteria bacterium]|nr:HAD-IC family P-type ATPase [Deltaproteobacteria bacterium]